MEVSLTKKKKKKKEKDTESTVIRKGTWKAEEDQVLIQHVEKFGPREWSSIRSKGLLQRTGKSCRLRWVNKLQPNLKTGCKFTEEEERVVIELQARFGNKWAKIATHLTGRTDNDVKNFWSSRQKRLARILRNTAAVASCSSSSSSKPPGFRSTQRESPVSAYGNLIPLPEATMLRPSSTEEETPEVILQSDETIKTESFHGPVVVNPAAESNSLPPKSEPVVIPSSHQVNISFPEMKTELPAPEQDDDFIAFSPESQQILAGLGENPFLFFDVFGSETTAAGLDDAANNIIDHHHQIGDDLAQPQGFGKDDDDEDFPANYMFDQIDDLPSPSKW